ncbi:ROK family transcriptional regulator [Rhizobium lemnae]|uniref:MarR family transcriptional regulator n=1 Tax=Rhizobium lemnae TaxID=1214924 RepID=A0ABV8EG30_9HYPH|nr:ROK family transcriptional regulator [Rhizobium lemnae]MCJ8510169.1 ROK family transcriptional regulator [Rhizobium lemnae]
MQKYTSNQRMLLDVLRCHQPITRADVTDLTDLTQQSVHRILEGLIADGLVVTERGKPNGRGKPSPSLQLNNTARYTLGIAIDNDSMRISVANFSGISVLQKHVSVSRLTDGRSWRVFGQVIESVLGELGLRRQQLCGIGAATDVEYDPSEARFDLIRLPQVLGDAWSIPVFSENLAAASAIGESLSGVGKRLGNFAFICLDKKLSGALVTNGVLFRGSHDNAGNYRYLFSSLEELDRVSLPGLLASVQSNGVDVADVEDLLHQFDVGLPGILQWIDDVSDVYLCLFRALAGIFDPDAVVLGGRIPRSLGAHLIQEVSRKLLPTGLIPPRSLPSLLLSEVAGDAAATGSALLPLKNLFFR